MKHSIIRLLGGVPRQELELERALYLEQRDGFSDARKKIAVLEGQNLALEARLKRALPLISVGTGDPEPTSEKERAAWVREWAAFFPSFLEPKLMRLISEAREELDWSGMPDASHSGLPSGMSREHYDWMMRGTSNAFRLLIDYGKLMMSEHKGQGE